jgi:anhydro-N-acetylmuramic acid kinase
MSGTSADAVDAVLIECTGTDFVRVAAAVSRDYPTALRYRLIALAGGSQAVDLETLCEIDEGVAQVFSDVVADLLLQERLDPSAVEAIGSHGQTVFHRGGRQPLTLQLGNPGLIAERTGITTIGDFRRRDIALGGQGAPLVPAFHHALFASADEARAVVNIGGIANLTLLPGSDPAAVRGFDTGPGNALMDEWIAQARQEPFDTNGRFASIGTPHGPLLDALLGDPYFAELPPKSTGRGDFHLPWVKQRYPGFENLPPADVQATFAELTAHTIIDALRAQQPHTRRLLACGGGVRNSELMRRLTAHAGPQLRIETTAAFGLDPQAVEGAAFAWLAMRTLDGADGNLPGVTGAMRGTLLGGIYRARPPEERSATAEKGTE